MASHNVAITTSYADGELFVIENEPPDTIRKGSQNEPRPFEKVLCGEKSSIKDITKACTITFLFQTVFNATQQFGKDSCRASTFISHNDNGTVALKRSPRKGEEG